jgi:Protein of unknown function (DUF3106)
VNTRGQLRLTCALLGSLLIGAAASLWVPVALAAHENSPVASKAVDRSPTWASLTPVQQQALAPLQRDWAGIDQSRKQKWLVIASRFPTLPADERKRVQERMTEWTHMTPAQRNSARLQFNEARQVSAEERQAKWQAYQALPEAERQSLAQRAKPVVKTVAGAPAPVVAGAGSNGKTGDLSRANPADGTTKRNVVQAPVGDQVKPVAPVVVQAKPGATTSNMSTRLPRPSHSQPGTPKIAATPGYVDRATLLPKRGAQGAAAAGSSDDIPAN